MGDSVTRDFWEEINYLTEKRFEEYEVKIRTGYDAERYTVEESLWLSLKAASENYFRLKECGKMGPLESIYLSFLYMSAFTETPHYRIFLYDGKGRSSLCDCDAGWNFEFVFQYYHRLKEEMTEKFRGQKRVKEYELENRFLGLAARFYRLAGELIPGLLAGVLPRLWEIEGMEQRIDIYQGAFLDKAELLFRCSDGKFVAKYEPKNLDR